jgi:Flp pilus assembly protein TadG
VTNDRLRACPDCGRYRSRGQALAEFALIAPVALFVALGFLEAGMLVNAKGEQDRATAVVASWTAEHPAEALGPSYALVVASAGLDGCDVDTSADDALGLVTTYATCTYAPRVTVGLWDGLPIGSAATAALPAPTPTPTPTPEPTATP